MTPNPSDKLLEEDIRVRIEKTKDLRVHKDPVEKPSATSALQALDVLFACLVVAPLTVGVWRGCWGLMDLNAAFFPFWQSYILGMLIHICFALVRSHLLTRSAGARSGHGGSSSRWIRERVLSRFYTVLFMLSCILQWRGGWGVLDSTIDAIVGVNHSRRPGVVASITVCLVCAVSVLRVTRNLLAAPYFLVTDGKEPTYIFKTRFWKNCTEYRDGVKSAAGPAATKGCAITIQLCREMRLCPANAAAGRDPMRPRTRPPVAARCVGTPRTPRRSGARADKEAAAVALPEHDTRAPPANMRGSTAGLADTLAGGSRAHATLLAVADAFFASVVIAPAVVFYWRSTWALMDIYLFPGSPVWSATASSLAGGFAFFLMCVLQVPLAKTLHPDRGRLSYYIFSRVYTALFGAACVNSWRGTWNLLDEFAGIGTWTTVATTAVGVLALAAMRGLRNISAAPFAIAIDTPHDYFEVPTMFRTSGRDTALYVLDCMFSVGVVGSLVVFAWRGLWTLLDIFIYPDDAATSTWASLVIGYVLVTMTFALQAPMRWACSRLHGAPRLLLADIFHFFAFVATVNVWRSYWGLLQMYFLPDSPRLSNWISHTTSLALLMLLNCSNSVLVRGVYIDAEEPAGECVVFPCHYLRMFFHRERTKKRHRQALLAAAAAAAKKSGDAAAAPLAPLASLAQEKV